MKSLMFVAAMLISQVILATEPPANYPVVKGELRKIDIAANRLSIKHEQIPNLSMPPMTMSFLVQDTQLMNGLSVGDKINFVADEIDGDLTVLWLEKQAIPTLPIVKGIVRKVDLVSKRVSIKHEAIPNLDMPGMTMLFIVQDSAALTELAVGDNINFTADEIDGELTVLWFQKVSSQDQVTEKVFCIGTAPTTPKTNVEIEIRSDKFSTIRYEFAEGAYKGTSYINSIGRMSPEKDGSQYTYKSGDGILATTLVFRLHENKIIDSRFSHFSSGMNQTPVQCLFQ